MGGLRLLRLIALGATLAAGLATAHDGRLHPWYSLLGYDFEYEGCDRPKLKPGTCVMIELWPTGPSYTLECDHTRPIEDV